MPLRNTIAKFIVAGMLATVAQSQDESDSALGRVRERLLADLERLPRYTCIQTITRRYYKPQTEGASCKDLIAAHGHGKSRAKLRAWDRLRLEVAIVDRETVFSWVGAPRFESGTLEKLAGGGPLSSGDFGPFLHAIMTSATVTFQGEQHSESRRLLAYSYDVPLERSKYMVRANEGWTRTAYSGEFSIDPEAADIVSLTVRSAELPPNNPGCQAITEIDYGRTPIHDRMILIPRETRLIVIDRQGSETESQSAFTGCREYAAKSRIVLEGLAGGNALQPGTAGAAPAVETTLPAAPPTPVTPFPAGLHFRVRILTTIDSTTAAAGDPIDAVLLSPIRDVNNVVLAPAGSRVHARLLGFEQRPAEIDPVYQRLRIPDLVQLSMQFESIELRGKPVPLRAAADQQALLGVHGFSAQDSGPFRAIPGNFGVFVFPKTRLHLEKFDWSWTTLPAADQK